MNIDIQCIGSIVIGIGPGHYVTSLMVGSLIKSAEQVIFKILEKIFISIKTKLRKNNYTF